jgi:hypothetical protein
MAHRERERERKRQQNEKKKDDGVQKKAQRLDKSTRQGYEREKYPRVYPQTERIESERERVRVRDTSTKRA